MSITKYQIQRDWDDLPYIALISEIDEQVLQAAVLHEGRQVAHLFLLKDGLLALTDIDLKADIEPTDQLLLAIARVQVEHLRACREGRCLV